VAFVGVGLNFHKNKPDKNANFTGIRNLPFFFEEKLKIENKAYFQ
jgi:hypothetical protein